MKDLNLDHADLDEIGCQSLRCGMSILRLTMLLNLLGIKYKEEHIETITQYRNHLQRVTRSHALGF